MKTLVIGHVTHDLYEGRFVAGGCAFYGARVHSRLCDETTLVSVVGEDFVCDEAIADLNRIVRRQGETTVFANYYPETGPRVQLLQALAPPVTPELVPDTLRAPDLLHLAPVLGEVDLLSWKEALSPGLLAINVQGWIKRPGEAATGTNELESLQRRGVPAGARQVVQKPWRISGQELAGVDIACLSEEDLIDQGDLLERLIDAVPIVALTRGGLGSRIFFEQRCFEVGIYPAYVVDPTGAGDVFAATFSHKVAHGLSPLLAARYASAAASIAIEDIGPRALSRLSEMEERLPAVAGCETLVPAI